ncbi:Abscisic acid G-protein coupled receptor-domain-containing protein [Coniochaeta sp. 2T2.1]|nr:Abscisic acid G-protein coupled receptor-domain-containing protein [Coniochaeta sp. 2T2.1]
MTCSDTTTLCGPPTALGTLLSLTPFIATFLLVFLLSVTRLFPYLSTFSSPSSSSQQGAIDDGEDHLLPTTAPPTLKQAHAAHAAQKLRPRVLAASAAFGATLSLAVVLAELILAEIVEVVEPGARNLATRVTVSSLVALLVGVVPALEVTSLVDGLGLLRGGQGGKGRRSFGVGVWCVLFAAWLGLFWGLGGVVPRYGGGGGGYGGGFGVGVGEMMMGEGVTVDNTAASLGHERVSREKQIVTATGGGGLVDVLFGLGGDGGLSRACLERIGVIGISLMALLSGFASVSSPWHTFVDNRAYKRRPVTDADVARKQAGLDATSELLITKRHRLRALQRKVAAASDAAAATSGSSGFMGKMIGSLKGIGGSSDAAEIKSLQVEISGLEAMESTLSSSLSVLRNRKAAHARDGTALGRLFSLPGYVFSVYCIYRILATSLTTARRLYQPQSSSFSSSDPINRFLGLLARHWDPKLDQIAWARQISFLLSGVILAASANSVLQTFHLFARWAPALLRQARANLALIIGQVAATYVISSALLLRSNLPREVGRSVADALESALEPAFVDRWFEGWFLVASAVTAVGIWVSRQIGGSGMGEWDDWEEFGAEELGTKRS